MDYAYSELLDPAQHWAHRAVDAKILELAQVEPILKDELCAAPLPLVANARPLIVAFLGGTGVGKSSLLNRLAGDVIAKVGVVRPTSKEVTLYHHASLQLAQLPADLPLASLQIAQHTDATKKNMLWIDMPDFDSTEIANKNLVFQWLPHIDVLIYVVSPERYRDHKAWQVLQAEKARHAWIFVLNQCDKATASQYEDLKQQLAKAGFAQPVIFQTSCLTDVAQDEFSALVKQLTSLATAPNIQHLVVRGDQARKLALKQQLQLCASLLGSETAFQTLQAQWQTQWQVTEKLLKQGVAWSLQQQAQRFAQAQTDVILKQQPLVLWDEWAQNRFDDTLNELILNASQLNAAGNLLKNRFLELRQSAGKLLHGHIEIHCRQALAKPGERWQRILLRFMSACTVLLPLTAFSIVGYQVFHGYYASIIGKQNYLGVDFVAHSLLVVIMSWLLPYFIEKKLQPSIEKTALRGLQSGLNQALVDLNLQVKQIIVECQQLQTGLVSELQCHISHCENRAVVKPLEKHNILNRMLMNE